MIKLFELLTRRADMTHDQSMRYWTEQHAALVKQRMANDGPTRRYINNVGLPPSGYEPNASPYDGVVEAYLNFTPAQFVAAVSHPGNPVVADEPNFLARRPVVMMVEERLHLEPKQRAASKALLFLRRLPDMDHDAFIEELENEYAPAAIATWGAALVGLSINRDLPVPLTGWGPERSPHDAVVEFWFDLQPEILASEQASLAIHLSPILDRIAAQREQLRVREVIQIDLPLDGDR